MQLEADQREQERVDEEDEDLPEGVAGQSRLDGRELRCVPAHVDADRDRGEHTRDTDRGGREVRQIAREEGDRDLRRRVVDTAADLAHHVPDGEADRDAADDIHDEMPRRVPERERAGNRRGDGGLIEDEGHPVVDETLSFENRCDAPRDVQATYDLGCRESVRRRDDRAEGERRGPGETVDHDVRDECDTDRRHCDETDRKQCDRPQIRAQVTEPGEERRRIEKRWQDRDEHEIGRKLQARQPRRKAEQEPARDKEHRHRHVAARGEREHRDEGCEQPEKLQFVVDAEVHGPSLEIRARRANRQRKTRLAPRGGSQARVCEAF